MSKQVGESMDRICLFQISTLEGKIRFVLGVSDRVINYRFKNSRSVSFS